MGFSLIYARGILRRAPLFVFSASLLNACAGGGTAVPGSTGGTNDGSGGAGTSQGGKASGVGGSAGRGGVGGSFSGTGGVAGSGSPGAGTGASGTAGGTAGIGGHAGFAGNTSSPGGAAGAAAAGGTAGQGGSSLGGDGGVAGRGTSGAGGAAGAGGTAGAPPGSGTCGGGAVQASDITIDETKLEQQIRGFGVSSAWAGSYANKSDPDYLWSTTTGAGLTLLRIRYGDGLAIAQAAVKYGATVWLTPWGTGNNGSPGGSVTTAQTDPNGCTGKGSMPVLTNPQEWANNLVTWVQNAKSQGVPLYAVSAENEPDSCGINQTTSYSATQLATWIGGYLGPAMAPLGVKVMGPETQNACGFKTYYAAIQSDTAAWNAVDIFASHEYGCGTLPSEPAIATANKEYWETEVDTGTANGDSPGDGIASALLTATTIHNDLTKANLNAWHYWWLYCSNNSGCLYDTGTKVWAKRLWVMGNFSRFVRPGWKRVSTSGTPPSGVLVSAYLDPTSNALSIVAINSNTSPSNVSFYVTGGPPCSLTPYETSASKDLGEGASVKVAESRVTVALAAQSVTTFVGRP